jgi:hypothetical protein
VSQQWEPLSGGRAPTPKAPPKRSSGRLALLSVGGLGLLALLSCAGVFTYAVVTYAGAPAAQPEDRRGLLNLTELVALGLSPDPPDGYETVEVEPWLLGSREWAYELEPSGPGPWMVSARTDDRNFGDARTSFAMAKFLLELEIEGDYEASVIGRELNLEPQSGAFMDRHQFYLLELDGQVAGNLVVIRRGLSTFAAAWGPGHRASEAELLEGLEPGLARALAYEPTTEAE